MGHSRFLSGEAPPKVLLRQNYRDVAIQPRDVAERKQWLIRKSGGVVEEDMVADWLGVDRMGELFTSRTGRVLATEVPVPAAPRP